MKLKTDKYEIWPYDLEKCDHAVYSEDSDIWKMLEKLGFSSACIYFKGNKTFAKHYVGTKILVDKFLEQVQTVQ